VFRLILLAGGAAAFLIIRSLLTTTPDEAEPGSLKPAGAVLPPAKVSEARPASPPPAITHLEFRDKYVTIKPGVKGPVYEVKDKEGKVLLRDASEMDLQASDPALYRLMRTAMGAAGSEAGLVLDARVKAIEPPRGSDSPSTRTR